MTLSENINGLLRYVDSIAMESLDQRLTLLAVALVLSCRSCGVQKREALAVIASMFDDDGHFVIPASETLH